MKRLLKSIWFISVLALTGCFEKDVFPDTPSITFEDVVFYDKELDQDSLVVTFTFKDGNGNIGLDPDTDIGPPFHFADAVLDGDTSLLLDTSAYNPPYITAPISFLPRLVTLRDGPNQTRSVIVNEFQIVGNFKRIGENDPRDGASECDNYLDFTFFSPKEIGPDLDELSSETFRGFILPNDTYYNFIIKFYEQLPNGDEQLIDFEQKLNACTDPFNARIPVFDPDGNEGVISYGMKSNAFRIVLGLNPIKLEFYIIDQDLNQSNTVSTGYFFLEDVTITQ
ncbi:hypothetical protein [Ekhidna sp.]|uniref:hypothetical protein n=1 Tax=Ekhidna sp. TaxID=2608089 RepID=UPI003B5B023A